MYMISLILWLVAVATVNASETFNVYRMIQYNVDERQVGPQRLNVNLQGVTIDLGAGSDLRRRIVVLLHDEIDPQSLVSLIEKGPGALLIILPDDPSSYGDSEKWSQVEQSLLTTDLRSSTVYFTWASPETTQLYAQLKRGEQHQLTIGGKSEAAVISNPTVSSVHGYLGSSPTAPTIAIVTYYDALGVSPHLSRGANSNGSGLAALLELARLYSQVLLSRYNLMFVVTGGARLNYRGSWEWAAAMDPSSLDHIELVVCLDTLGGASDKLYLHHSRSTKTARIKRLLGMFKSSAQDLAVPFEVKRRRIDLSDPVIYWQHEIFARKNLFSLTISSVAEPLAPSIRSNVLDTQSTLNMTVLSNNIRVVAESLAKYIFGADVGASAGVFQGSLAPELTTIDAFIRFIAKHPRVEPLMDSERLLQPITRWLRSYLTSNITSNTYPIKDKSVSFRRDATLQMTSYYVTSYLYNIYVPMFAMGYLYAVYQAISWIAHGTVDLTLNSFL